MDLINLTPHFLKLLQRTFQFISQMLKSLFSSRNDFLLRFDFFNDLLLTLINELRLLFGKNLVF